MYFTLIETVTAIEFRDTETNYKFVPIMRANRKFKTCDGYFLLNQAIKICGFDF